MRKILLLVMLFSATVGFSNGLTISKRYEANIKNRIAFSFGSGFHHVGGSERNFPTQVYGLGVESLYGRLFQAFELFPGLEVLSSSTFGFASKLKAFQKYPIEDFQGFYADADAGIRYLHALTEHLDLGGYAGIGYGLVFGDYLSELYNVSTNTKSKDYLWYPLHLRGGLAMRYTFSDSTSLYGSLLYTVKDFGDNSRGSWLTKDVVGHFNKHGIALPVGLTWSVNKNIALFSELEIALQDVVSRNLGFRTAIDVGISFDFMR